MIKTGDYLKNRFNGKVFEVVLIKEDYKNGKPPFVALTLSNGVKLPMNKMGNWVIASQPQKAPKVVKAQPKPFEGYVCDRCGKEYKSEKYYNQHIIKCERED